MGVRKGHNNFAAMQKKKVTTKSLAIQSILKQLGPRIQFATITSLVKYVSEKIGCHHTTILRQPKYMTEIRAWWAKQGVDPSQINRRTTDSNELRSLLTLRESELSLCRKEVERLKKVIATLNVSENSLNNAVNLLPRNEQTYISNQDMDTLCRLLKKLLDDKLGDMGIKLGTDGSLIDTGFGYTEIIASEHELKPYLQWLTFLEETP